MKKLVLILMTPFSLFGMDSGWNEYSNQYVTEKHDYGLQWFIVAAPMRDENGKEYDPDVESNPHFLPIVGIKNPQQASVHQDHLGEQSLKMQKLGSSAEFMIRFPFDQYQSLYPQFHRLYRVKLVLKNENVSKLQSSGTRTLESPINTGKDEWARYSGYKRIFEDELANLQCHIRKINFKPVEVKPTSSTPAQQQTKPASSTPAPSSATSQQSAAPVQKQTQQRSSVEQSRFTKFSYTNPVIYIAAAIVCCGAVATYVLKNKQEKNNEK
jgi:hypothetical protein